MFGASFILSFLEFDPSIVCYEWTFDIAITLFTKAKASSLSRSSLHLSTTQYLLYLPNQRISLCARPDLLSLSLSGVFRLFHHRLLVQDEV